MERVREAAPSILKEAVQKTAGVAKILCFLHVANTYVCRPVWLIGPSMLPTIKHNSFGFAESISTRLGRVGPGDVVVIRSPENPTKIVVKRIKAAEGDVVSYAPDPNCADEIKTAVVPKGHVWVEGDNKENSRDAKVFGAIPYAHVLSRVFLVVWPPEDIGFLRNKIQ